VDQRLGQDQIAGFKAGFCAEAAQKKCGLNAPAAGVLFASVKKMGFPVIYQRSWKASNF
jgi:2-keto-4-pentenoate hydratase